MDERFETCARKGDVSMVKSNFGYFEVWTTDGSQGEPQRFYNWDDAVDAFEWACFYAAKKSRA